MKKVNVEAISGGASKMVWGISQIAEMGAACCFYSGLNSIKPGSGAFACGAYLVYKAHQIRDYYYAQVAKEERAANGS